MTMTLEDGHYPNDDYDNWAEEIDSLKATLSTTRGIVAFLQDELKKARDVPTADRMAHKVMTPDEYRSMPVIGWHEVCRDVDGFGGVGIRFCGISDPTTSASVLRSSHNSGERLPSSDAAGAGADTPSTVTVGERDTP